MAPPSTSDLFPKEEQFDTLVRLKVGYENDPEDTEGNDGAHTFEVFKGVLCFYSGYFTTMFAGPWLETEQGIVQLPTKDPYIIDFFVQWIHTRRFYNSTLESYLLMDFRTLARIWIFADAHDVPMLQNEVIEIIIQKTRCIVSFFTQDDITYIVENTTETSKLRCLVDHLARELLLCASDYSGVEAHEELTGDNLPMTAVLVNWTLTHLRKQQPSALAKIYKDLSLSESCSRWHVHRDGRQCPSPRGKNLDKARR